MAEAAPLVPLHGLIAEFRDPEALVGAARRAREAGFRCFDAFTPFPVDGLAEAIGFRDRRVPLLTLIGGVVGAATGYGMQVYTNLDYPLNVGGRALVSPPAFLLITFELMVLFAVLFSIGGMFLFNRLPRLHHPLFGVEGFSMASLDAFFLVVFSDDGQFDPERTRQFLEGLRPVRVAAVPSDVLP